MSGKVCFYELHARAILGVSLEWRIARFESEGEHLELIKVSGGIYPAITRGKNKGKPNWKKPEPGTKRSAWFTEKEHQAFLLGWEKEHAKCSKCQGTGQEWAGWDHITGNKHRPCTRCGATGNPPQEAP